MPSLEKTFSARAKEGKIEKISHFRNTNEVLPTLAKPNTRKEISAESKPIETPDLSIIDKTETHNTQKIA